MEIRVCLYIDKLYIISAQLGQDDDAKRRKSTNQNQSSERQSNLLPVRRRTAPEADNKEPSSEGLLKCQWISLFGQKDDHQGDSWR